MGGNFFSVIWDSLWKIILTYRDSVVEVGNELKIIEEEHWEYIKPYSHSDNERFDTLTKPTSGDDEVDKPKAFVRRDNYAPYMNLTRNKLMVKYFILTYWKIIYLCIVASVAIMQIMYYFKYITMKPPLGLLILPMVFYIMGTMFKEFGYR
jgi:hypothetical protein